MKFHRTAVLGLSVLSMPCMAADTCDSAIVAFLQRPVISVIDPDNPDAGPSAAREKAIVLFAQGHELCSKGLEAEGVAAITQALALPSTP